MKILSLGRQISPRLKNQNKRIEDQRRLPAGLVNFKIFKLTFSASTGSMKSTIQEMNKVVPTGNLPAHVTT
jgi:hypothetical protein